MSIRRRIFYLLFCCLTLSAIIIFGTFYTLTSRILYAQTDVEIQSHAEAVVNLASQQISMFDSQVLENSPGMMIAIGNPQGEIIASTIPETESRRELGQLIEKSAGIIQPAFLNKQVGTNAMRIGIFPVAKDGKTDILIMVGHPTDVIDHALTRLVYQLALAILLIIFLSLLLSSWITRAVMAPITTLTEKLELVSDANLTVEIEETKTKDELARLTHAFSNMMRRIRASFDRERQLIGELAHELKTPLAVAKSKLDLSLSKPRNKEDYLEAIKESSKAVDTIGTTLTSMLELAWASAEQPLQPEDKVRFDLLLAEAVEVAEALAMEKKLKIKTEIEENPPGGEAGITVAGKKDKLFRVLLNILDNAVKYSPHGGMITVSLKQDGNRAKLEVSNIGSRISEADLSHVFEPYYRGYGAGKKKGNGLGLAIVKRIVEAHGGNVEIRSTKSETNLVVNLPLLSS